jgi:hypothetical protein
MPMVVLYRLVYSETGRKLKQVIWIGPGSDLQADAPFVFMGRKEMFCYRILSLQKKATIIASEILR